MAFTATKSISDRKLIFPIIFPFSFVFFFFINAKLLIVIELQIEKFLVDLSVVSYLFLVLETQNNFFNYDLLKWIETLPSFFKVNSDKK